MRFAATVAASSLQWAPCRLPRDRRSWNGNRTRANYTFTGLEMGMKYSTAFGAEMQLRPGRSAPMSTAAPATV